MANPHNCTIGLLRSSMEDAREELHLRITEAMDTFHAKTGLSIVEITLDIESLSSTSYRYEEEASICTQFSKLRDVTILTDAEG